MCSSDLQKRQCFGQRQVVLQGVGMGDVEQLGRRLTLTQALAFLAELQGLDNAVPRARNALDRLGLASRRDAPVRTLSQGQRRRGALARLALDDTPRTWLLDEPYDALDSDSAAVVTALIQGHAARGGAVLLTSHQPLVWPGLNTFDLAEPAA